ncbi:hypothetical protein ACHQM5_027336 [Ranunculus cassubicifolius]
MAASHTTMMESMAAASGISLKALELLEASFNGDLHRLKQLAVELDDGKGIAKTVGEIKDEVGIRAIHVAAVQGQLHVLKYLIGDLKLDVDVKDIRDKTPLIFAIEGKHLSTASYLLEMGASLDVADDLGATPLHYAAGNKKLLHLLVSRGANVDVMSPAGTPLERAALNGDHEAIEVLLNYHANPNLNYRDVWTPLLASLQAHSFQCVQLLLEAGADPDDRGLGIPPLEVAANEGLTDMVLSLLKAGANPNVMNEVGQTPIEVAAISGNNQIVEILLPKTKPISKYSKWSLGGIMKHVHSKESREQRQLIKDMKFEGAKPYGDNAFREKDYTMAVVYYSKAIAAEPSNATLYSNRSLCWLRLEDGKAALKDARRCMMRKPDWPKAHYRAGAALYLLKDFEKAAESFLEGLKLDPGNEELKKAYQEVVEAKLKPTSL